MSSLDSTISTCRHCQHYQAEGRRGGHCQQLGAVVQGTWKACYFAIPPFAPSWERLEEVTIWQDQVLLASETLPTNACPLPDVSKIALLTER